MLLTALTSTAHKGVEAKDYFCAAEALLMAEQQHDMTGKLPISPVECAQNQKGQVNGEGAVDEGSHPVERVRDL